MALEEEVEELRPLAEAYVNAHGIDMLPKQLRLQTN